MEKEIYTIGTSTRSLKDFIKILLSHGINVAVDVRRFPFSKRFPHFCKDTLALALKENGVAYFYLGNELGGLRKSGYERYTNSKEFREGIERLESIASTSKVTFFCCERLFFRCHRRFIAKILEKKGWKVYHIVDLNVIYREREED